MRKDALVGPARDLVWLLPLLIFVVTTSVAQAQTPAPASGAPSANIINPDEASVDPPKADAPRGGPLSAPLQLPDLTKRENFSGAMQMVILLTILSLAPAILIMM